MRKYKEYKIAKVRMSGFQDRLLPIILENDSVCPLPSATAVRCLVNGNSVNSIDVRMRQIKLFLNFCLKQKINYLNRLKSLEGFTIDEISALTIYCKLNFREGKQIAGSTYQIRLQYIYQFIEEWYTWYLERQSARRRDKYHFQECIWRLERMQISFKLLKSQPFYGGVATKGLNPDLREKFFRIIEPDSRLNPWSSKKVRWRNYIMLLLLIRYGLRRGEALLLELQDICLEGNDPHFTIQHRERRPYPRQCSPQIKTRGRLLKLPGVMVQLLSYYIQHQRVSFRNAYKSSYLFLSERDGLPLHQVSVNALLKRLIEMYPEYKGHLSPHRLRNTFHDMLKAALISETLSESPLIQRAMEREVKIYSGGWSPNSKMPDRYADG